MRMKVLVTGVGGQLGHDVMNELYARLRRSLRMRSFTVRPGLP